MYLLHDHAIGKYIFYRHIELPHVIVTETVSIPAHCFQEQVLYASKGKVERDIPFRVECLCDAWG